MSWKDDTPLRQSIVFHIDTGSSRAVLVGRVARDPDVAGVTEAEVEAEVNRMVQEKILAAGPNPHAAGDQFLVVTEFMPRTAQRMREANSPDNSKIP